MRLFRLVPAVLALALIAGAPLPAASAATPKPDPAPVKPSPPATTASQPATTPTYTAATPTTPSSTTKAKAKAKKKSHKRKKHKQVTGSVKLKSAPTTLKPKAVLVKTGSKGLHSTSSNTLKMAVLSLLGVGVLLLVLATVEPIYMRPRRLITTYAEHRGDMAIAGVVILCSVVVAYLSTAV